MAPAATSLCYSEAVVPLVPSPMPTMSGLLLVNSTVTTTAFQRYKSPRSASGRVGLILGVVLAFSLLPLLMIYLLWRYRRAAARKRDQPQVLPDVRHGCPPRQCIAPAMSERPLTTMDHQPPVSLCIKSVYELEGDHHPHQYHPALREEIRALYSAGKS